MSKIMYNDRAYGEIIGGGGAGGLGGGIELTQAEYDALDQEEKDKDIIYFITDGNPELTIVNDSVPVGAIQAYAGTTPPSNWLICDGRAVNRIKYKQLFDIIGTTYGSGDGEITFNLPNLQGRVAIGQSMTYELGASGGEKEVTLTIDQIPSHNHIGAAYYDNNYQLWDSSVKSGSDSGQFMAITGGPSSNTHTLRVTSNGNDQPHNNMQPYLVTNYIIKTMESSIVEKEKLNFLDTFYPIGSCYETQDSEFNPNIEWGGTWTLESISNDEIIEENTSGIWTYRKWKSGISECWGIYINNSVIVNTAWGSLFEGFIGNIDFPTNLFIAIPSLLTTYYNNGIAAWIEMASGKSASQTGSMYAVRPTKADTAHSYGVSLQAKGLWKAYSAPITYYRWHRTA